MPVRAAACVGVIRACSLSKASSTASPFSSPAIQSRLSKGGRLVISNNPHSVRSVMMCERLSPTCRKHSFVSTGPILILYSTGLMNEWRHHENYRHDPGVLLHLRSSGSGACPGVLHRGVVAA